MRIGLDNYNLGKDDKGYLVLPKVFNAEKWHFQEVKRIGGFAIYLKTQGNIKSYEVITVKYHDAYKIMDNDIPAKQAWPGDEEFGVLAWAYCDLPSAEKRFNQLINKK